MRAVSLTVCHLFGMLHFALGEKNLEALISHASFPTPRNGGVLLTLPPDSPRGGPSVLESKLSGFRLIPRLRLHNRSGDKIKGKKR